MAIRPILTAPNLILRQVSQPVEAVTNDIRVLMDDMLESMYAAYGIGLAAIQIGVAKRVIVMDLAQEGEAPAPQYFVNPVITDPADEKVPFNEGCLSLPEYYEDVDRPAKCTVDYLDYNGNAQRVDATGMLAVCIQHEMDHLEGILFVDHLSRLKRERILKKLKRDQLTPAS